MKKGKENWSGGSLLPLAPLLRTLFAMLECLIERRMGLQGLPSKFWASITTTTTATPTLFFSCAQRCLRWLPVLGIMSCFSLFPFQSDTPCFPLFCFTLLACLVFSRHVFSSLPAGFGATAARRDADFRQAPRRCAEGTHFIRLYFKPKSLSSLFLLLPLAHVRVSNHFFFLCAARNRRVNNNNQKSGGEAA